MKFFVVGVAADQYERSLQPLFVDHILHELEVKQKLGAVHLGSANLAKLDVTCPAIDQKLGGGDIVIDDGVETQVVDKVVRFKPTGTDLIHDKVEIEQDRHDLSAESRHELLCQWLAIYVDKSGKHAFKQHHLSKQKGPQ
ncbi:hypothetical protein OGAPHI_007125 [Ogataea philodendri]|uniref:Uncharacterized protein n=1 Tax=Ogataea philodendri TaxID=1378263 RepID=A0A9P8NWV3_9ASCO|nr:uncharacterized protein OGAPHI_007125 [Ogataea philodendri]KAH3660539.1 hypothetical protein OGAPHI_007125 [Ogataea philodendri]